jgi:hypothetical protein
MRFVEAYRLTVFTHPHAVEQILSAVRQLAELRYGNYIGVSWTSAAGEERFTPLKEAAPALGEEGKQEIVPMCRVEFSIPRDRELLDRIILNAIYPHHEWEEPVISVIETLDAHKTWPNG